MSEWEPTEHVADPVANAILNVAEQLAAVASAVQGLSVAELSVAEAIEKVAKSVASLECSVSVDMDNLIEAVKERT